MVDVDIDLLVKVLRQHGHKVEEVISVPENAGGYELKVDGTMLNLEATRELLEKDS